MGMGAHSVEPNTQCQSRGEEGQGSEDLFLNGVISLLDFSLEAEDVLLQGLDDSLQLYLLSLHCINVGGPLLDLFLQGVELKIQKHRKEHSQHWATPGWLRAQKLLSRFCASSGIFQVNWERC